VTLDHTTRVPGSDCPACGYHIDAATCVEGNYQPSPGDPTVCVACGAVLVFTEARTLRATTAAEVATFPAETRRLLTKVQQAVGRMNAPRN